MWFCYEKRNNNEQRMTMFCGLLKICQDTRDLGEWPGILGNAWLMNGFTFQFDESWLANPLPASHVWWTEGTPISEGHHFEPEPKTNIRLVRRQHKKGKWLRHNLDTTTCHNHQTTNPHPKLYNGSGSLKHHDSYPLLLIYPISIPKHQNEMMEFCRKIVIRPPHPSKSPRKKQQHKSQNCFSMTQWIIILYIYISS